MTFGVFFQTVYTDTSEHVRFYFLVPLLRLFSFWLRAVD